VGARCVRATPPYTPLSAPKGSSGRRGHCPGRDPGVRWARGLDPRGGTLRPDAAATAPALRFRGSAEQRTGTTTHPET
jgi:hypothetical protein